MATTRIESIGEQVAELSVLRDQTRRRAEPSRESVKVLGRVTTGMLQTLSKDASVEAVCGATDEDGGVIVADLLDAGTIAAIESELRPHLEAVVPRVRENGTSRPYGARTRRLQSLAARSDAVIQPLTEPVVLGWAERRLASHTGGMQLNSAELIEIGPGEVGQRLHADGALLWPDAYDHELPDTMVSCMFALTDFTEENGATRVVPGSHVRDVRKLDTTSPPATAVAEMRRGSALLFSGKLWHGGGPNATVDFWRRGLVVTYAAGWLRPEEALCLSVSRERARQLPHRLQELIGYRSYVPHTESGPGNRLWGYDKRDASEALCHGPIR